MTTNEVPTTTADAIRAARGAQEMNMREFGQSLGVTLEMVRQWEDGVYKPSGARIWAWMHDDRPWVRALAADLLVARYGAVVAQLLVPA